eukprot:scaffold155136_cov23-Prasinocladus_malaysianus.AAC.1
MEPQPPAAMMHQWYGVERFISAPWIHKHAMFAVSAIIGPEFGAGRRHIQDERGGAGYKMCIIIGMGMNGEPQSRVPLYSSYCSRHIRH